MGVVKRLTSVASVAIVLAACSSPGGTARPTDPHLIVTDAVRATAAIPTFRLHIEGSTTLDPTVMGGAFAPMRMAITMDADVDLATRQFAGRQTMQMTGGAGDFPNQGQQSTDIIVTSAAVFARQNGAARWTKVGAMGLDAGPTNTAIAAALIKLLDDPRVTYDKADATSCTLGTCDHVIAHVNAAAIVEAFAALAGVPVDAASAAMVPDVDLDVRIDQKTSVLSEIRASITMQGQAVQALIALSNPGDPIQITAPNPALVDDMLGGGQVNTILETVGDEVEPVMTPEPSLP